jgi:hypothetical protein
MASAPVQSSRILVRTTHTPQVSVRQEPYSRTRVSGSHLTPRSVVPPIDVSDASPASHEAATSPSATFDARYRPAMTARAVGRCTLLAGVLVCCSVTACGISRAPSSAAPPIVVCGQTITGGAAGSGLTDATGSGTVTVTGLSPAGVVLQLSKDCRIGATVRIIPSNALRIAAEAHAQDGQLAAIVLVPRGRTADVAISRPDGSSTTVAIRLAS